MRPIYPREDREHCPHLKSVAIRSDLPNSYDGRQWCSACGVFFIEAPCPHFVCMSSDCGEPTYVDWPFTEAADREQQEREAQMRLPE